VLALCPQEGDMKRVDRTNVRSSSAGTRGPIEPANNGRPLPALGRGPAITPVLTRPSAPSVSRVSAPRLLTVRNAANYLGISMSRVRSLIHREVLTPVRIPLGDGREERRHLLDVADLDALIEGWKQ
jgi:excisionase family DNA binding protein